MTTALDLITRSLLDIQVIQGGESPSASESSDALAYLKDILSSWDNEGLMCYGETPTLCVADGSANYAISSVSTSLITPAPTKVDRVEYVLNNIYYELSEINADQYWAIPDKTVTGIPDRYFVYYNNAGAGSHNLYLYPIPTTGIIALFSNRLLSQVLTYATVLNLPAGYERALRLALSVELMPMYNKNNPLLIQQAEKAKRDIKSLNSSNRRPISGLGLPINGVRSFNILTGY